MGWFRRKRGEETDAVGAPGADEVSPDSADSPDEDAPGEGTPGEGADVQSHAADEAAEQQRQEQGPFDVSEVEDATVKRIDLGALKVPAREGMELRIELEEKTQRVIAVTVVLAGSTLQLQAFAAPRTLGVWDDIRGEIAAQVTKQGGTADEVPGVFGRELIARIPVRTPDGRTGHQASRFVGVDGPRWFLRGVFGGPASHDHAAAAPLEEVLRGCVVVRGSEAMAPRDLLALTLPAGAARPPAQAGDPAPTTDADPQVAAQEETEPPAKAAAKGDKRGEDDLAPFERGPEITETR